MQRSPGRGVPKIDPLPLLDRRLDWNLLKTFLEVAECGGFRAAAARLGVGTSTISRHVSELEQTLETKLFLRSPNSVQLTEEGLRMLDQVRSIERHVQTIGVSASGRDKTVSGRVTLATTEGLGTYWLTYFMPQLRRDYPDLQLDIVSEMKIKDVLRHEADIALQYELPTSPDVVTKVIGYLHIWPYVSRRYAEVQRLPENMPELCKHHLIIQEADQLETDSLQAAVGATFDELDYTIARSSTVHYEMIRSGYGIGILPTYLPFGNPDLVPVPIRVEYALPIRLCYNEQHRNTARIRVVIDWLERAFSGKTYPFFAETLYTPFELAEMDPLPSGTPALKVGRGIL